MKVYVKSKPVRWGFKAYTLCNSSNAYNCSFELYTGRKDSSKNGLTYDLVLRLMEPYEKQG